jgi:hypothetical protein
VRHRLFSDLLAPAARLPGVLKKLLILAILVALGTIAAKKVRAV